ncbi:hypothetical protein AALP_AA7G125800 [Arabis alpina]|uniref:Uncharacterized protein n=1 Tax=Arabis alpina TaxID=50452 RepID=A0A087GHM5_ARAAL|nr:hypothetical protein AALP_AA7G125800 [Arabis alpina]
MGMAWAPMSAAWTPMRSGTSVSLGIDIGATACHRCHCSVTSVPGSLGLCSASCRLCDLSDAALMTSPEVKITSKVSLPDKGDLGVFKSLSPFLVDPMGTVSNNEADLDPCEPAGIAFATDERDGAKVAFRAEDRGDADKVYSDELIGTEGKNTDELGDTSTYCVGVVDEAGRVDVTTMPSGMKSSSVGDDGPMITTRGVGGPKSSPDADDPRKTSPGADASSSSSSSDSGAFSDEDDDEDTFVEVEKMKKAKKVKKKKCGISEEIVLVAPTLVDRADSPPLGYMTLFENYFDQCLLWFPLPRFLMRFLAVHGVCLAQINPMGIRHLLGIYVLSRECGVVISTKHFSYLTDFRVRCRSEELKHTVTNSSRMALIVGFPSKDDHFEDRVFFVEISERTLEADCIDLVQTRWERRGCTRGSSEDQEVIGLQHAQGGGSNDLDPDGSTGASEAFKVFGVQDPSSSSFFRGWKLSPQQSLAERLQRAGLLSLSFDRLVRDYDEDVRSRDSELSAAKEANAALQSRLDELAERSKVLEVQLRGELSSANDLQRSRIKDVVAEVKDEMARGFSERTSKVAGLLAEIGGKAQNDMLNLTEIDVNLEFIGLLQGLEPPGLSPEVKVLHGRRHPIYDTHDVFADLLASVRRVLEIHVVLAGAAEASVAFAVNDNDEDDVEATDDDENAED